MPDLARPSALEHFEAIRRRLLAPAVFLDYDGTLVEIAPRPEQALMGGATRALLEDLARLCPVTIVTGRGLEDIMRLVDIPALYYAASHGYDIVGPDGLRHQAHPNLASDIAAVTDRLRPHVDRVEGTIMESKVFSIAVHYRLVEPGGEADLEQAIDEALRAHPNLEKTTGKKLFEIRPNIDWHKGAAVSWLCKHLDSGANERTPLFIGDDLTDEDALRDISGVGTGIFVGPRPSWNTAAHFGLANPEEVGTFLRRLTDALQ